MTGGTILVGECGIVRGLVVLGFEAMGDCDKAAWSWALVIDIPSACSSRLILTVPYSFTSFKLSLHTQTATWMDVMVLRKGRWGGAGQGRAGQKVEGRQTMPLSPPESAKGQHTTWL